MTPQSLYTNASRLHQDGNLHAAEELYRQLIDEHPSTEQAKYAKIQLNNITSSLTHEPTSTNENATTTSQLIYKEALNKLKDGNQVEAKALFNRLIDEHPDTEDAKHAKIQLEKIASSLGYSLSSKGEDVNLVFGWLFALIGLAGLIAMFVYLSKGLKRKAGQSIALPALNYTLTFIMVASNKSHDWFPDSQLLAGLFLLAILPLISYSIVVSLSGISQR